VDPSGLSAANPYTVNNRVGGKWTETAEYVELPDPLNGDIFLKARANADWHEMESGLRMDHLATCGKSGLHNPLKEPERYLLYGAISAKAAEAMRAPEGADFFARLIQRVAPKSYAQALGEVTVTRRFLENFSGDQVQPPACWQETGLAAGWRPLQFDYRGLYCEILFTICIRRAASVSTVGFQVRFLARSFAVPGDHTGQVTNGYRWPYGPVAIVSPFNFPL
ncbi:unnamed protein product, partial [Phaeothamnion confervicola]